MANVYLIPSWFFTYSILLEIAFAFITAFVAIYSFKIYNLCKEKDFRFFSIGFGFISASYIIWSIVNLFLLDKISDGVQALTLQQFVSIGAIGIYFYMLLSIIGFATLAYITLKVENKWIYSLLILTSIIALGSSANKAFTFYILSSLFILYITAHYFFQFKNNKKTKNFLIPVAFLLLLLSHIHFIFAIDHYIYYVIGHIIELIAYILILTRLILIIKK